MRLTVLMDNNTYIDRYYTGEPAAAYYVEDGERNILFDTGYSGAFIKNAEKMGIDLRNTTDIVISHGHNDHTGGLRAFSGIKFNTRPKSKTIRPRLKLYDMILFNIITKLL